MLGYIVAEGPGEADAALAGLARRLAAEGIPLAGVVQTTTARGDGQRDDMDLRVIGTGRIVRISQTLGAGATGCRLDPAGLEEAVGLVAAEIDRAGARLLLLNRFGRQEAEGHGFRPLIGRALGDGIVVLTAVGAEYLPAFATFAGGMEERLPADVDALARWCRAMAAAGVSPE